MSASARILIVEDESSVRELVALHLRRGGFAPLEAASSGEAWPLLTEADALVLDRMLPDESGDAFLRRLRSDPAVARLPVLMLTARASEHDRVGGLEAGADDYLTKPFSAAELVARLRALLRRLPPKNELRIGEVRIDLEGAAVSKGGTQLTLTRREFDLLVFLASNPDRVFSRAELLDRVWGGDFLGSERTVDQHVAQLRSRLGEECVETVRGKGYRIAGSTRNGIGKGARSGIENDGHTG
ncbi:MAG TPA: response regulator transcription factor [Trueperaceae bacterium]